MKKAVIITSIVFGVLILGTVLYYKFKKNNKKTITSGKNPNVISIGTIPINFDPSKFIQDKQIKR